MLDNLMGTLTLEGILTDFTKVMDKLERFAQTSRAESDRMASEAEQLRIDAEMKAEASARALNIRDNIANIVNG